MCMYIYIHTRVCIYIYTHLCIYIYMHVFCISELQQSVGLSPLDWRHRSLFLARTRTDRCCFLRADYHGPSNQNLLPDLRGLVRKQTIYGVPFECQSVWLICHAQHRTRACEMKSTPAQKASLEPHKIQEVNTLSVVHHLT